MSSTNTAAKGNKGAKGNVKAQQSSKGQDKPQSDAAESSKGYAQAEAHAALVARNTLKIMAGVKGVKGDSYASHNNAVQIFGAQRMHEGKMSRGYYIEQVLLNAKKPLTTREVTEAVAVHGVNAVPNHLRWLRVKGLLVVDDSGAYSLSPHAKKALGDRADKAALKAAKKGRK